MPKKEVYVDPMNTIFARVMDFILALAPFFSVIGALFRAKKVYVILLLILTAEFIFAIIRPLIMAGGRE